MTTNRVLDLMRRDAASKLDLETVELEPRQVLHAPGAPTTDVYFPLTAVIGLVSTMESGASAEVGLVGREGFVGLSGLLGGTDNTTAVVLIGGSAIRGSATALANARADDQAVRSLIDTYLEARLVKLAQTAACHRLHSVDERLARWLLSVYDRVGDDAFTVSQEVIAQMVGAHRPTVAAALQRLQQRNAVAYRGRALVIADPEELESAACECRRIVHREFERLLRTGGGQVDTARTTSASSAADAGSSGAIETAREIAGRLLLASLREQEARQRAESANQAKDAFLAMVSHELRTPLDAILGWCAMLASSGHDLRERGLAVIERNARAQLALVNDLLDAARITSGTLVMQPVPVDLTDLAEVVLDTFRPVAEERSVALSMTTAGELPAIQADRERIQQVLLNVVGNAVKFTPAGGRVGVQLAVLGTGVQVCVSDTGIGISPDMLPHVFERFQQGAAWMRKQRGLGLGLSISRAIIELHGGTIQLTSPGEGRGATCTIDLPITPPSASALRR